MPRLVFRRNFYQASRHTIVLRSKRHRHDGGGGRRLPVSGLLRGRCKLKLVWPVLKLPIFSSSNLNTKRLPSCFAFNWNLHRPILGLEGSVMLMPHGGRNSPANPFGSARRAWSCPPTDLSIRVRPRPRQRQNLQTASPEALFTRARTAPTTGPLLHGTLRRVPIPLRIGTPVAH